MFVSGPMAMMVISPGELGNPESNNPPHGLQGVELGSGR
jgi:hypothetical protein